MTGFGDASDQADGIFYSVEIRSLNNRYYKASVRLPESLSSLEAQLDAQLRQRLSRGSVTLTVKMHNARASKAPRVNDDVLVGYLDHLETLRSKTIADGHTLNIDLTALLALPGVLQTTEDEQTILERAQPAILRLMQRACDKLTDMRDTEGRSIADELTRHRCTIDELLAQIAQRAPRVIESYHEKLRTRMDDLLARAQLQVDEKDLIREVAIFAERADIAEEVSRMTTHMQQLDQIISDPSGEPAGRTLDFLAQEMLREANTIASKSNDAQISRAIVDIKGAIDRIKEQVQNVE